MSGPEFEAESRGLVSWFLGFPGATFHSDIQIVDLRAKNAGRGIVATADIPAEVTLFTIPRDAILSKTTSSICGLLPSVFDGVDDGNDDEDEEMEDVEDDGPEESWTSLILILIWEHLQGTRSKWKPYLDILPAHFDTPMFWSDDELRELQASAVVTRTGREKADGWIQSKILPVVRAHEDVFFPKGSEKLEDGRLVELAHRLGSAIMAYSFELDADPEEEQRGDDMDEDGWMPDTEGRSNLGMVPMADILNADAVPNAYIHHREDALCAVTLGPIKAGEEILNYYGPLSNGELLRRYGYVTEKHSWYDVIELPWSLVETALYRRLQIDDEKQPQVMQRLERYLDEDEVEDGFVLDWGTEESGHSLDEQLSGGKSFKGLPKELEEQFKAFLKAIAEVEPETASQFRAKTARKSIFLDCALEALEARASEYATALEDDRKILVSGELPYRRKAALAVRIGEKELLKEAHLWVRRKRAELT